MFAGICAIVCCSVLLGTVPSLQNLLRSEGYSIATMNLFINILETTFLFAVCKVTKRDIRVTKKQLLQLALCGFFGVGATSMLLNNAYQRISVGLATMVHFLYPTMVCVYMSVFRRERFTKFRALAVAASIGGMAMLCGGISSGPNALGIVFALSSTLSYGFYVIANGSGDIADMNVFVKPMYIYLFSSIEMLALVLCTGGIQRPAFQPWHVPMFALVAVCFSVAASCIAFSIRRIGSAATSFFNMLEPVVSFVVSAVFFHDAITWEMLLGCGLVLCAVALITTDQRMAAKTPAPVRAGTAPAGKQPKRV